MGDRRVINGIVQVLKSGGRWTDAPREIYGPKKILYIRFVRGAAKGVWVGLLEGLAQAGGPPTQVLIDSSMVKAHRCAARGEGGGSRRRSVACEVDARPRSTPSPTAPAAQSLFY